MEEEKKYCSTEIPVIHNPDNREYEKIEIEVEGGR